MIRVLLADGQVLVRAGFRLLLEPAGDIAVVGEGANGGVVVALAREHAPDVVLVDVHMPEVDGSRRPACSRATPGWQAPGSSS